MQALKRERFIARRTERIANVGSWELSSADILSITDGVQRILGVEDGNDIPIETALSFLPQSDREELQTAIARCRETGEPFNLKVGITTQGRQRWVRFKGQARHSTNGRELYGTIQDITQQTEREQRLMVMSRVLRHNLRNKLSVIRVSASHLDEEFAGLETQASDLLSLIDTHNIDRELTEANDIAISGSAERTNLPTQLCNRIEELAGMARYQAEHATKDIGRIINATDELTSLGDKVRKFEQTINRNERSTVVPVSTLVSDIVADFRKTHPDVQIDVDGTPVWIHVDSETFELALRELIENAITHSIRDEPTVEIQFENIDDQAQIRVADDGPGIPEMEREVLRKGEESPLTHGSGIGLWTVDLLMTRCGGQITIEDNDPTGAVVTLRLPAATHSEE